MLKMQLRSAYLLLLQAIWRNEGFEISSDYLLRVRPV